jgi:hypothetical protein
MATRQPGLVDPRGADGLRLPWGTGLQGQPAGQEGVGRPGAHHGHDAPEGVGFLVGGQMLRLKLFVDVGEDHLDLLFDDPFQCGAGDGAVEQRLPGGGHAPPLLTTKRHSLGLDPGGTEVGLSDSHNPPPFVTRLPRA